MKKTLIKKWIAGSLSCALLLTGSLTGPDFALASPSLSSVTSTPLVSSQSGKLVHYDPGKGPSLFHIQTVHGDYEAQQNIANILEKLSKEQAVDTVFVEGTAFELKPERFRFFSEDPELTNQVTRSLVKKGLFKGADLFLVNNPEVRGFGIENLSSYTEDLALLRQVLQNREMTQVFTEKLFSEAAGAAGQFQNPQLRQFMREWLDFERGAGTFSAWIHFLKAQTESFLRLDAADSRYQLILPAMTRLMRLQALESEWNEDDWQAQQKRFLLLARIYLKHRKPLLRELERFLLDAEGRLQKSPADMNVFLEDLRSSLPLNFNFAAFGQIQNYFARAALQQELDSEKVVAEIDLLVQMIQENLAASTSEKQFVYLIRQALLFERLFEAELTPLEYSRLDRSFRPSDAAVLAEALGSKKDEFGNLTEIDEAWRQALEFYRLAAKRDGEMIENVERLMQERNIRSAAVITGGFHTKAFQEYFSLRDYSYALISPRLQDENFEEGRRIYLETVLEHRPESVSRATLETSSALLYPDAIRAHTFSPDYADAIVREVLTMNLAGAGSRREEMLMRALAIYERAEQRSDTDALLQQKKTQFRSLFAGFKTADVDQIFEQYPALKNMDIANLHAKFNAILSKTGVDKKSLKAAYTAYPNLFSYSEDNVVAALKQIQQLGVLKKDQMLALRNFLAVHDKIRGVIFEEAASARRIFPSYHHVRRLFDRLQLRYMRMRSSLGERRGLAVYVRSRPQALEKDGKIRQLIAELVRDPAFTETPKPKRSELRSPNFIIEKIEEGPSNATNFIPATLAYVSLFSELMEHGIKAHFFNMGSDSPELQVRRQQLYYTPPGSAASQPIIGHDLLIKKTVLFSQQTGLTADEQEQLVRFHITPVQVPRDPRLRVSDQQDPDYVPFIYDDEYPVYLELALTPDGRSLENLQAVYIGGIRKGEYLKLSVQEKREGSDHFTPMNVRDLVFRVATQSTLLNASGQPYMRMDTEDVRRYIHLQDKESLLVEAGFVKELPVGRSELRSGEEEYVHGANLRFLMGQSKVRLYPGTFLLQPDDTAYQDDLWNQKTAPLSNRDNTGREKIRRAMDLLAERATAAGRQDILDRIQRFYDLTTLILKDLPTNYFFTDPDEKIADATRISLQSRAIYLSRRLLDSLDADNDLHMALLALYLNRAQYLIDVFHDLYGHGATVNLVYDFIQEQIKEEGFKDWDLIFDGFDPEAIERFIRTFVIFDREQEDDQKASLDVRAQIAIAKAEMLEEHFEQAAAAEAADIEDELLDRAGFQLHARELEKLALEYQSLGLRGRAIDIYRHAIQMYHHTQSVDAKNLLPKEVQVELLLFLLRAGMYVEFHDELRRFLLDRGYPQPLFAQDAEALKGGDQTAALWIPDWILGLAPKILYNLRVYAAVVVSPDARRHILEVQASVEKLLQDYWARNAAHEADHDLLRFKTYGRNQGNLEIPVQNNVEAVHAGWLIEPADGETRVTLDFYGSDFNRKKRTPFAGITFKIREGTVFIDLNAIRWDRGSRRRFRGIAEHMTALAVMIGRERGAQTVEVRDRKGKYAEGISKLGLLKSSVTVWQSALDAPGLLPPQSLRIYRADFHDDMVNLFKVRYTMPRHIQTYLDEQGYRYSADAQFEHDANLALMRDLFGTFDTQETVLKILQSFGFFDGPVIVDENGAVSFRLDDEGKAFIESVLRARVNGNSLEISHDARLAVWRSGDPSPGFWNKLHNREILNYTEPGTNGDIRMPLFMIFEDVKRETLVTFDLSELLVRPEIHEADAFSAAEEIRGIREKFIADEYFEKGGLTQIATIDLKLKRLLWDVLDGYAGTWKKLGGLSGGRPLLETLSLEFDGLQGLIDPLFLPSDDFSLDFQKALYKARSDGLLEFEGRHVFEIGSGTGVNMLHLYRVGASRVTESDIQMPYISFTRWNSQFMRDTGHLPDTFPVDVMNADGLSENTDADIIVFNTPQIIADGAGRRNEIVPLSRGMERTPFVHLFEDVRDYLHAHPGAKFMLRLHSSRGSGLDKPHQLVARQRFREADVIMDFLNSYPDLSWEKIPGTQFFILQSARHELRTLYLSRGPGEQIMTGHDGSFAFKVLSFEDGQVTVGLRGYAEVRRKSDVSEPEIIKARGETAMTTIVMRKGDVFEYDTGDLMQEQVVRVHLVRIGRERVRFGIDAPREVPVHRQEIFDAIQDDPEQDSDSDFDDFRSELRSGEAAFFFPLSAAVFRSDFLPLAEASANPDRAASWLRIFSGVDAPREYELPQSLIEPGAKYAAGKEFGRWLAEAAEDADEKSGQGAVVIDTRWTSILMENPRALYLLLKSLKAITGREPLIGLVTGSADSDQWVRAVRQKGNLDWRERMEFENELLPDLERLIHFIPASDNGVHLDEFSARHQSAVAGLVSDRSALSAFTGAGRFILSPENVDRRDDEAVVFAVLSMMKAASLLRNVPAAAQQREILDRILPVLFPESRSDSGGYSLSLGSLTRALQAFSIIEMAA